MRGKKPGGKSRQGSSEGVRQRVEELLHRLAAEGPRPLGAAEELDRLQGRLAQLELLEEVRERVAETVDAWARGPLRGELAQAWLTLVGGFALEDGRARVAALAVDTGLPAGLRIQAGRTLAALGGEGATATLLEVLQSRSEPQVRAAAAEALTDLGDPVVVPLLEALLEEDLPRPVWAAVQSAVERLG